MERSVLVGGWMQWWNLKQLRSGSAKTRLAAVEKLGSEGEASLVDSLAPLLSDPDTGVRAAAALALGHTKADSAVAPLLTRLQQEAESEVRRSILKALQEIGSPAGTASMAEALSDPCGEVAWQAAQALKAMRWEPATDAERAALHLANNQFDAAVALGAAAIAPLTRIAHGSSFHQSIRAIEALAIVGGSQAVKPILSCLESSDYTVRSSAATALGEIGDARALEPLIGALRDTHHQVCLAACVSLGKLGDERSGEPLVSALQHRASDVRAAAVEALAKLGSAAAVPALIQCLRDPEAEVREGAAKALGNMADEQAIEHLVIALTDAQTSVRQAAAAALGRIQPSWERSEGAALAIPALQSALKSAEYWVRHSAADVLKKLGLSNDKGNTLGTDSDSARKNRLAAHQVLCAMLADQDRALRQAAAETVGRMGFTDSVPNLLETLGDPDRGVKRAAARALEVLRWRSDQGANRARQLVALERWGEAAALQDHAIDALVEAARWNDPTARRSAAEALVQIGTPSALCALQGLASDADEEIRADATLALNVLNTSVEPQPSLS